MSDGRIAKPEGDFSPSTGTVRERRFDLPPVPPSPKPYEDAKAAYAAMSSAQRQTLGHWVTTALKPSPPVPGDGLTPPSGIITTEMLRDLCLTDTGIRPSPDEIKGALLTAGYFKLVSSDATATSWDFGVEYRGL